MIKYISNSAHYQEVIAQIKTVKHTLWIGTADIKDLYVELGKDKKPFLALIAQLIRKGVEGGQRDRYIGSLFRGAAFVVCFFKKD